MCFEAAAAAIPISTLVRSILLAALAQMKSEFIGLFGAEGTKEHLTGYWLFYNLHAHLPTYFFRSEWAALAQGILVPFCRAGKYGIRDDKCARSRALTS